MSYHDVHVTTAAIKRTSLFNLPYNLQLICTRAGGWELWSMNPEKCLAAEYDDNWLVIDVAGHVILDSRPPLDWSQCCVCRPDDAAGHYCAEHLPTR